MFLAMTVLGYLQARQMQQIRQQLAAFQGLPTSSQATSTQCLTSLYPTYQIYTNWAQTVTTSAPAGDPMLCSITKTAMELYNEICGDFASVPVPDC